MYKRLFDVLWIIVNNSFYIWLSIYYIMYEIVRIILFLCIIMGLLDFICFVNINKVLDWLDDIFKMLIWYWFYIYIILIEDLICYFINILIKDRIKLVY